MSQSLTNNYDHDDLITDDLALVNAISRQVNALTDKYAIFRQVVASTTSRLGLHPVIIFMIDAQTGEAVNVESSLPDLMQGAMRIPPGLGLIGTAMVERRVVVSHDVKRDARYRPTVGLSAYDVEASATRSEIVIPLLYGDELLGLLDVQKPTSDGLSERDKAVLEALAHEVAAAIYRTRQTERLEEQAWVSTAQFAVAQTISEHRRLDSLLDAITRIIPILLGGIQTGILLWDDERERYIPSAIYGAHPEIERRFFSRTYEVDGWSVLAAMHVGGQGIPSRRLPPWHHGFKQSCAVMPLQIKSHRIGALFIINNLDTLAFFHDQHDRRWQLMENIAIQTAQAIDREQIRLAKEREQAKRRQLLREIEVARGIQTSLIPLTAPEIPGLDVAAYWQAAQLVSGDFYDFMALPDGRYGIIIADVSGKGMPSALFMTLSRTILRAVAFSRQEPAETLHRSNQILFRDTRSDMFVTVFYAVWNPNDETLIWANGGHNRPLLVRDGIVTPLTHRDHEGNDIALGVIPHAIYHEDVIALEAGDTILFYTDGVTEAANEAQMMFSEARLRQVVQAATEYTPTALINAITEDVALFVDGMEAADDVTMVALKKNE